MSTHDTIREILDTIGEAMVFNYGLLPLISLVIYGIWTIAVRRAVKSVWYISFGVPGAISLALVAVALIFFPHGTPNMTDALAVLLLTLIYMPGYIVPTIVLIYHVITFSSKGPMTRSAYLFAIPIVMTYLVNWIVALYLERW